MEECVTIKGQQKTAFGGWWNCSLFWLRWWLLKSIHVLKFIELNTKKKKKVSFTICWFFFFLAVPRSLQNFSSLTRDRTRVPAVKAPSPNHWTTREFPVCWFLKEVFKKSQGKRDSGQYVKDINLALAQNAVEWPLSEPRCWFMGSWGSNHWSPFHLLTSWNIVVELYSCVSPAPFHLLPRTSYSPVVVEQMAPIICPLCVLFFAHDSAELSCSDSGLCCGRALPNVGC